MIAPPPNQPVVHLIAPPSVHDAHSGFGRVLPPILCAQAIRTGAVPNGQIMVLGDRSSTRAAVDAGLRPNRTTTPPLRNPRLGARFLRSQIPESAHVICWNDELAGLLGDRGASSELISTAPQKLTRLPRARTMIRVLDDSDRNAWADRNREAILDRDLPALVDSFKPKTPRDTLRNQMGLSNDTILISTLTDAPGSTDAREFSFLLGLLAAAGYRVAGLIPVCAHQIHTARRHQRALRSPFRLLFTETPILSHLAAIDLMLHINRTPSGSAYLLERLCENVGVPVMRLGDAGRRGLVCDPNVPAKMIERFDELVSNRPTGKAMS